MKSNFQRPALAMAAALLCLQNAAAVPVVINNLGAASDFSGLAGSLNALGAGPGHKWDPVTQKAKMDPNYALLGAPGLAGGAQAQGGSILPAGVYGGPGLFGTGGALPAAAGGVGQLTNSAPGGSVPQPVGVPVTQPVGGPVALGAGANAQGASLPLGSTTLTSGAIVDGGVPYGADGVTLNPNRIGPSILAVAAVPVPDAGSAFPLLSLGLVSLLLAFGAMFKKRGQLSAAV